MSDTTFVNTSGSTTGTPLVASWFQDLNNFYYRICGTPTTAAQLLSNIGAIGAASPTFTGTITAANANFSGTVTAPTPGSLINTTQIPTTQYLVTYYAPLASPTFTGTVTTAALTATGLITPSTTAGIKGTTAGDNANAGSVGEYQTNGTSGTSLTSSVNANATSISLPAGDWDVSGVVAFTPAGSTTTQIVLTGISSVSATFGGYSTYTQIPVSGAAGVQTIVPTPPVRVNISTTTTIYLVVSAAFSVSTMTCNGTITARRRR